jgi:hypothetical protein
LSYSARSSTSGRHAVLVCAGLLAFGCSSAKKPVTEALVARESASGARAEATVVADTGRIRQASLRASGPRGVRVAGDWSVVCMVRVSGDTRDVGHFDGPLPLRVALPIPSLNEERCHVVGTAKLRGSGRLSLAVFAG